MNNKKLGTIGEQIAVNFLNQNGYTVLDTNYRPGRLGEIDIVAADGDFICFIEVKTRTGNLFGTPAEAISNSKMKKMRALAWNYLKHKGLGERNVRFDIVEITGKLAGEEFVPEHINLIRSAF